MSTKKETQKIVPENAKIIFDILNITAADIMNDTGMSSNGVYSNLRGDTNVSATTLAFFKKIYGINPDYLVGKSEQMWSKEKLYEMKRFENNMDWLKKFASKNITNSDHKKIVENCIEILKSIDN